jgi:hypothetical protein
MARCVSESSESPEVLASSARTAWIFDDDTDALSFTLGRHGLARRMDAYLTTLGIIDWRKVRRWRGISPAAGGPGLQAGMCERSEGFVITFTSQ